MLNRLWSWLRRLFASPEPSPPETVAPPLPATPQDAPEPALAPRVEVQPAGIAEAVREAELRQTPGNPVHRERAFLHTRLRVRERYGFTLNRSLWDHWNVLLSRADPAALRLRGDGADTLWRIMHGPNEMFLVFEHGFVVTALPPDRPYYADMIKEAEARRHRPVMPLRTYTGSAKQVGRGNLDPVRRKPKPKAAPAPAPKPQQVLPPKHLRPVRNEARLAALKAQAVGRRDAD